MLCRLVAEKSRGRKTGKETGWKCHASSLDELSEALVIHLNQRERTYAKYRRDGLCQNPPGKVIREDGKEYRVRDLVAYYKHGYSHRPGMTPPAIPRGAPPHVTW